MIVKRCCLGVGCILVSGVMAGCVTLPPKQAFNRNAHASIKTIYVLQERPVELQVAMLNNPAGAFGLIGGLIAAGQQASMSKDIDAIETQAGFQPLAYFQQVLTLDMEQQGYRLVWPTPLAAADKIDRDAYGLRKEYSPVDNADAELDLSMGYFGFEAGGPGKGSPYRPTVRLSARLITSDGKQNLFTDVIAYNNLITFRDAITLDADPRYAYPTFSDLKAAGPKSVDGLKQALESVALTLAKQL